MFVGAECFEGRKVRVMRICAVVAILFSIGQAVLLQVGHVNGLPVRKTAATAYGVPT